MSDLNWWQKAVFYQIYPRSFADSNGDGIGDFRGMIDRLDYIKNLGVDALWISPCYPSPQFDIGYDVSDYTDINPEYGTLTDFKEFLEGAHERGLRVILDLVPNHTSDQHPWFLESRSSLDNPKRDWYIWRDGKDSGPPNNWNAGFLGSAWELDPHTGQYYYHYFFKEQPDLNWRNPELKQAMWKAVRFWLDMGVDGFRLDAIGTIFEDQALPDQPLQMTLMQLYQASMAATSEEERKQIDEQFKLMFQYQVELPEVLDLMKELRAVVNEYKDRMLVGETDLVRYYGDGTDALHMLFNFPLMNTKQLTPAWVRTNQNERALELPKEAWPCNTLGNHDSPRVYSRYRSEQEQPEHSLHGDAMARIYLALMLTLRGTAFIYNGDEIGMIDLMLEDASLFRDNLSVFAYEGTIREFGMTPEMALPLAARMGRDKNRTPMQWSNSPNAGFSPDGVNPWLPVNPDYLKGINVAEQENDPDSLLNFYKHMLHLRKQVPALIGGDYTTLHTDAEHYLAFQRYDKCEHQTCLVILNFSDQHHILNFDMASPKIRCLFSSQERMHAVNNLSQLNLAPYEIYIGEIVSENIKE